MSKEQAKAVPLDTSVIVGAHQSPIVAGIVSILKTYYRVGYPGLYLKLDIERSSLPPGTRARILRWAQGSLADLGSLSPREEHRILGRYGGWVKKIRKLDVLIAYLAVEREYLFVTGDWPQLQFYYTILSSRNPNSSPKAMYVPVRWLALA